MAQHVINLQIATGAGSPVTKQSIVTNDQQRHLDKVLAPSTTNSEEDLVLTNAQVKSLVLSCVGGDLTIKTNSTSAPDNTVTMAAGDVTLWSSIAGIGTNPFVGANVTKLYLSSTAGCTFTLDAIVTSTNG